MGNRNNKSRPGRPAGWILAACAVLLAASVLLGMNAGVVTAASAVFSGWVRPARDAAQAGSDTETAPALSSGTEGISAGETEPLFARPEQMRGVWLTPGTDFLVKGSESAEQVRAQVDAALAALAEWNMNTVLVPVIDGGETLFASDYSREVRSVKEADGTAFDVLGYIGERAKERGMFTYGTVDFGVDAENGYDPSTAAGRRALHGLAAEAAKAASFDGWLLRAPGYAKGGQGSFDEYMRAASGMGYENYLQSCVTAAAEDAVAVFRAADSNAYIGLLADAVWADTAQDPHGLAAGGLYQSLTDGYADTRGWTADGLFDFVMVNDAQSTKASLSFGAVLDWWVKLCTEQGLPLYVSHAADKTGGGAEGWASPDQLAQQVLLCQKTTGWGGSAFRSYSALAGDTTGSTRAVLNAFGNTLNEEYISRELVFTTPVKTKVTTNESTVNIRGSADPNFALTMNGKAVELSEHGFFSLDLPLEAGDNTFTFEHKGKTVKYTVTYRVVVMQSVEPSTDIQLDGGTTLSIGVKGFKGAEIYAKINGKTIKMKQADAQADEDKGDKSSDYTDFAGSYTLPAGIIGKTQNLGAVTVYGSYRSLSETKAGGKVTVRAKADNPVLPKPDESGLAAPVTGKLVVVKTDYAESFSGSTTDDYSRPTNAYLPQGTVDVVVSEVYNAGARRYYYLLGCGRRVYQNDVALYRDSGTLEANALRVSGVSGDGKYTALTLDSAWKAPYNLKLVPQKYSNPDAQNYTMDSFTATCVDITFAYAASSGEAPDMTESPLFSKAEWVEGEHNRTLRLYLRRQGAFYGYSVVWNERGQLEFRFVNPSGAAGGDKPLTGKRIVIDPGHGGNSKPKEIEQFEVLKYGLLLRDKLTALGATVVMTRTEDVNPSLYQRVTMSRNGQADLFLSIHMDAGGASARGYTVFYFNEYSYKFASLVAGRAKTAYAGVGGQSNRSSTVRWQPFQVMRLHDCPSILIECGFMTNPADRELLISEKYRESLSQAMADGIVDYFRAVSVDEAAMRAGVKAAGSSAPDASAASAASAVSAGLVTAARPLNRRRSRRRPERRI